jgi:hypothetical protein
MDADGMPGRRYKKIPPVDKEEQKKKRRFKQTIFVSLWLVSSSSLDCFFDSLLKRFP